MPIYEYQCDDCGAKHEHLQKINEAAFSNCPDCGGSYRKLLSAAGFQLKGSGWYATDFKGSAKPAASSESSEKAAPPPPCQGGDGACPCAAP